MIMVEINQIVREMELLPSESLQELADFINYLKFKKSKYIPETMLFSEKSFDENLVLYTACKIKEEKLIKITNSLVKIVNN